MKPIRDPRYLAYIRTQACAVPGCKAHYVEAAHTGMHGIGQKSSDYSAIPLCIPHHRTGKDSYHKLGPRRFSEVHNLDISDIVRRLTRKPCIRIEQGRFIAFVEGQEYVLSPVEHGIKPAVRETIRIRRGAA